MSARTEPDHTACEECSGLAALVTVINGRDDKPAWFVFKCQQCGYFNWVTPPRATKR